MFISALFIIVRNWKLPRFPSTKEWMKKIWYIHTTEYCLTIKKNDIRKFEGKWMKLEKPILSEISQSQKDKQILTKKWTLAVLSK